MKTVKSIFQPFLVNGPFDDPVLYVRLGQERGALLFDLGEIGRLTASRIMRVTDVFVSHAHIDHFIGFDHLLRIILGRDKRVRFHGPRGLIGQVRGKLRGYTWNLVEDYSLELEVAEFGGRTLRRRLFTCRDRFRRERDLGSAPCDGMLRDAPAWRVRAAVLDHRTPCLGYSLEEKARVNIRRERLEALGVEVGPWLTLLKKLHFEGRGAEKVAAPRAAGGSLVKTAAEWIREAALVGRGRKLAYVTDLAWSEANRRKIVSLASGADILYCEAAFMDEDRARARDKDHLTAAEAGRLARLAGAARLEVMHFSPRYQYREQELRREARENFRGGGP